VPKFKVSQIHFEAFYLISACLLKTGEEERDELAST